MRSIRLLGSHTERKPIADIAIGDVFVLTPPADANTNCVMSDVGVVIDRIELVGGNIKFVFHDAFTGCLFERKMKPTLPGSKAKRYVNVLKPAVVEAEALIARLSRADARLALEEPDERGEQRVAILAVLPHHRGGLGARGLGQDSHRPGIVASRPRSFWNLALSG